MQESSLGTSPTSKDDNEIFPEILGCCEMDKEDSLEDSSNSISGDILGENNNGSNQAKHEATLIISPPRTRNRTKGMDAQEGTTQKHRKPRKAFK